MKKNKKAKTIIIVALLLLLLGSSVAFWQYWAADKQNELQKTEKIESQEVKVPVKPEEIKNSLDSINESLNALDSIGK